MDYENTDWLLDFSETGSTQIISTSELTLVFAGFFKPQRSIQEKKRIRAAIEKCRTKSPTTTRTW